MRIRLMFGLPMWLVLVALAVGGYFLYKRMRAAD